MALAGSDKAYTQARSGLARSGAARSGAVWPLLGTIVAGGADITPHIQTQTLRVTQALNEQPDTASFDVVLPPDDGSVQASTVVGQDVLITLAGDPLFGGRVLTAQTTKRHGAVPSLRSVFCADYLQVLDSEYLITYEWPPQSATLTILDLIARFANKPNGVPISPAAVAPGLPSHARLGVINERFSTLLRRIVTSFDGGGGFYVDPLKVLHVWQGASEPGTQAPAPLTLANGHLKAFAETEDGSQQRDAVLVEGLRTTAPIGTPGPKAPGDFNVDSVPVLDASIVAPYTNPALGVPYELRIGTQRYTFLRAEGMWVAPAGTPQATVTTADVPYLPDDPAERVAIPVASTVMLTGRTLPWVRINEQWLKVVVYGPAVVEVPRRGYGALVAAVAADAVVSVVDSFSGGYTTGRYDTLPWTLAGAEAIRPQPIDADVVLTVRSFTGANVHEQIVQDGRYSRTGATNRGTREVADFNQALYSIQFESTDLHAKPGRMQSYTVPHPPNTPSTGSLMILTAELFWPIWGQPPRRSCTAALVHPADVVDAWLVDRR